MEALAREILASDTLLLVIDASAAPTDIETAFALFSEFLRFRAVPGPAKRRRGLADLPRSHQV